MGVIETYWAPTGEMTGPYTSERAPFDAPLWDHPCQLYGPYSIFEGLRQWLLAGYQWRGWVVPRPSLLPVGVLAQIEDRIILPPHSFLLGFSASSAQAAGFRFSVYDVTREVPVLHSEWVRDVTGAQDQTDADSQMHVVPEPVLILEPGLLQVRVANLATVTNDMQLLVHFAVPVGSGTLERA